MKSHKLRLIVADKEISFPSRGMIEALQSVGIATERAITISQSIEKHFNGIAPKRLEYVELMAYAIEKVKKTEGQDFAERLGKQIPPFVPIVIMDQNQQEEFSQRILSAELNSIGMGIKESNSTAAYIEQFFRSGGREEIPRPEYLSQVGEILEMRHGIEARKQYEGRVTSLAELRIIESEGDSFPFSRGILARSLMATGLAPDISHHLARVLEAKLGHREDRFISRAELRSETEGILLEEYGSEFSRRYSLISQLQRHIRPIIVLIGGAPGVGKSTFAAELGYRLGIPRIVGSDPVREALRSLIGKHLSPILHSSSYDVWRAELLPTEPEDLRPQRTRVVRGFLQQVRQLGAALNGIVERNVYEGTSVIMEGAHIVPGIAPIIKTEATVIQLVLTVRGKETHRRHFSLRNSMQNGARGTKRYLDHFEEIRYLQQFIVDQAREASVPVLEVSDFDEAISTALDHVIDVLLSDDEQVGLFSGEVDSKAKAN